VASAAPKAAPVKKAAPAGNALKAARKEVQRLEREVAELSAREQSLYEQMGEAATDHTRLVELHDEVEAIQAQREQAEEAWLVASEALEA
jgi:ATP-binding cassette subfamily F protein uup